MSDELLLEALTRFARNLTGRYHVADVLYELSESTAEVLGATAAGVTLADDEGRLRFANATTHWATRLEQQQEDTQQGPCMDAFVHTTPVMVEDLRTRSEWPD